ncbi:MAG: hypothetical protein HYX76_00895 [Acidobacteria bacterium]|nr:hypothetical protein [Acidobacteriota bacterium]
MNVDEWLERAIRDAEQRGLGHIRPLLEALARQTRALRAADWNDPTVPGDGRSEPAPDSRARGAGTDGQ